MEEKKICDGAKEVLTILEYMSPDITNKIPENFIIKLKELSANSGKLVQINPDEDLGKQDISEEAKDILSLIYYSYFANNEEQENLQKRWKENDELGDNND